MLGRWVLGSGYAWCLSSWCDCCDCTMYCLREFCLVDRYVFAEMLTGALGEIYDILTLF